MGLKDSDSARMFQAKASLEELDKIKRQKAEQERKRQEEERRRREQDRPR